MRQVFAALEDLLGIDRSCLQRAGDRMGECAVFVCSFGGAAAACAGQLAGGKGTEKIFAAIACTLCKENGSRETFFRLLFHICG